MDRWAWRLGVAGVVLGLLVGCAPRGGPPAVPPPVASAAPSSAAAPVGATSAAVGGGESAVAAFYRGKTVRIIVGLSPGAATTSPRGCWLGTWRRGSPATRR